MPRLPAPARMAYHRERRAARTATTTADRWIHLERAHMLSRSDPALHTRTHIAMFALASRRGDIREALGQIIRIVLAAPRSASGLLPEGDTGRADGPTRTVPIPADLDA